MKQLYFFLLCFTLLGLFSCKLNKETGTSGNSDPVTDNGFRDEDYDASGGAPTLLEIDDITGNWMVNGLDFEILELKGKADSFSFSSFTDSRLWSNGTWNYSEGELLLSDPSGEVELSLISADDSLINWENEGGDQVVFRKAR